MPNGFSSGTGSIRNNRKASSFYSTPLSNERFLNRLNTKEKSALSYFILSNGNSQSSRTNKFIIKK